VTEAEKLGFERIFISKQNLKGLDRKKYSIEIFPAKSVEEVYRKIF